MSLFFADRTRKLTCRLRIRVEIQPSSSGNNLNLYMRARYKISGTLTSTWVNSIVTWLPSRQVLLVTAFVKTRTVFYCQCHFSSKSTIHACNQTPLACRNAGWSAERSALDISRSAFPFQIKSSESWCFRHATDAAKTGWYSWKILEAMRLPSRVFMDSQPFDFNAPTASLCKVVFAKKYWYFISVALLESWLCGLQGVTHVCPIGLSPSQCWQDIHVSCNGHYFDIWAPWPAWEEILETSRFVCHYKSGS